MSQRNHTACGAEKEPVHSLPLQKGQARKEPQGTFLPLVSATHKEKGRLEKKKKKSHREGSASAGFFRELKTQRRQAPGLSRGAPPQPRKPLRYFGKKCLSTVDPRHLTQVSPLTFSGITILDHPNICVHLQKASAGHCF